MQSFGIYKKGGEMMLLDKVFRFFMTAFFAISGAALLNLASPLLTIFISTEILKMDMGIFKMTAAGFFCVLIGAIAGGLAGFLMSPFFIRKLKDFSIWVEAQMNNMPIHDVIAGAIGLIIGLIIAILFGSAFSKIPVIGDYLPAIFSIVLGYLGISITIRKRKELTELFDSFPKKLRERRAHEQKKGQESANRTIGAYTYKVLDTSVIIDGRIADIVKSGFLEGTLVVPAFVLRELQHIADSSDVLKRTRGRRGLDILQKMQDADEAQIMITNVDYDDIPEVDMKLVRLAHEMGGKLVTNDYNLNKVAALRGVQVLNINELSNAVKAVVIPGESMFVSIVKEGKEYGQGVAYLDDGTMIVIEDGRKHIGDSIKVEVTSALQTAAGRMIFAKPVRS